MDSGLLELRVSGARALGCKYLGFEVFWDGGFTLGGSWT